MNTLELALSLELDLEKYYNEQALLNKDNNLNIIFLKLAKEETYHANLLRSKRDNLSFILEDSSLLAESVNLFKNLKDYTSKIKDLPTQLDSYRMALEKEKKSVEFYNNLLNDTQEEELKSIFSYLLNQEKIHCKILEDVVVLLTRPEDWVESADFGLREDY